MSVTTQLDLRDDSVWDGFRQRFAIETGEIVSHLSISAEPVTDITLSYLMFSKFAASLIQFVIDVFDQRNSLGSYYAHRLSCNVCRRCTQNRKEQRENGRERKGSYSIIV